MISVDRRSDGDTSSSAKETTTTTTTDDDDVVFTATATESSSSSSLSLLSPAVSALLRGGPRAEDAVANGGAAARTTEHGIQHAGRPTRLFWTKLPAALASVPGGTEGVFWRLFGCADGSADDDDDKIAGDTFW